MDINKYFDHTLLKPDAVKDDIKKLCSEAAEYNFYSVCVNSCYVKYAKELLEGTDIKVTSVIGFPLGAMSSNAKAEEALSALEDGADELDMVLNIGSLKDGDYDYCVDDIMRVVSLAYEYDAKVKVIIETCLLTDEEKVKACKIVMRAGADFVKTSTGFSSGGADINDIKLIKETVKENVFVKASGGIHDLKTVLLMIEAGADRIGASKSVDIIKETLEQ